MNDDHVDPVAGNDDVASLADHAGDPAEIERDEAFLAALGAGERPAGDGADAALLAILGEWRDEVDSAPFPALPSDDEIAVALSPNVTRLRPRRGWAKSNEHHHGQRPALWQAATGAAAVAAMIVGGLSVAAHSAMPGDPLWGVSKSIFSDRAGDVELVSDLSEHLTAADLAARDGDRDTAERLLSEVTERLDEVEDAAERVELMKRRDAILRGLSRVTPSSVPSPAPAPEPDGEQSPEGPATISPGAPAPLPSDLVPPAVPGMPVIPLPLDGIQIPTTLRIPIDTQRLQDFLSPTTGQHAPDPGNNDKQMLQAPVETPNPSPTAKPDSTTASQVPTTKPSKSQSSSSPPTS